MHWSTLAAASALFLPSAALAQNMAEPAPAPSPVADTAKVKVKKICRPVSDSRSRMPESICRTQAEWDAIAEQADGQADKLRRRGSL